MHAIHPVLTFHRAGESKKKFRDEKTLILLFVLVIYQGAILMYRDEK